MKKYQDAYLLDSPPLMIFTANRLWKCNGDFPKDKPGRLYFRVCGVCVIVIELLVEQVRHSDCNKSVPLGKAVTQGCVDKPELIFAWRIICGQRRNILRQELALLIPVASLQANTKAGKFAPSGTRWVVTVLNWGDSSVRLNS